MSHNDEQGTAERIAEFLEALSAFTDAELIPILEHAAKALSQEYEHVPVVPAMLIESARRLRTRPAAEETP